MNMTCPLQGILSKQYMQRLTDRERFVPTQPLPEHQQRLLTQRRWRRPAYVPNHVPFGDRLIFGLLSLTWITWAVIGLLSGHMFLMVSRHGPIHFSGIPAVLFSLSVMASAAASAVKIVDHYDRRDNEDSYKKTRQWIWYAALALLLLSGFVGCAERFGMLPYTDGRLGLLSTHSLQSLLTSSPITETLAPHRSVIQKWSLIMLLWCFAGTVALDKLGLLKNDPKPRPGVALFIFLFLVGPALAGFTLNLVLIVASGSFDSSRALSDDALRRQIAWIHSMLLTSISMLGFLCLVIAAVVLRAIGVLPSQVAIGDTDT
jgi:hypothetical protein